ncbi:NUDIX hydrolase [Alphaproteobacteria bacterium]|nr:NUDIX hydrolase [Alphaproteobacteria bacterium]
MEHKIGVIPFDISGERIAIMFVTSQKRGRWILPKGNLKPNESHQKGCKREAFEEAGIKGKILKNLPLTHMISTSKKGKICEVAVTYYPMLVSKQYDEWPEKEKRERHWALLDDALRVTDRIDFQNVIKSFTALRLIILEAAK